MNRKIDNEVFVRVWQAAGSAREVAAALGMTRNAARSRAKWLRNKGVDLKRFAVGAPSADVERLRAIASETAPSGTSST